MDYSHLAEQPLASDSVGLLEGLTTTRAIRRYTNEPIPQDVLRDILWAATRAPSGSNRQPFRFVVLTDSPIAQQAKSLIATSAQKFWAEKRANGQYDKGSGADPNSPKSRMARTMQNYQRSFAWCVIDHPTKLKVLQCIHQSKTSCWQHEHSAMGVS